MLSGAEAVNAKGVVASEAAPNSTPVMVPRTVSGKWATDASVQLSREFEDWLAERPAPARDDEEGDETYATFMKQRRVQQDADRWQERRLKQWAARGAEAPLFTPHQQVEREFRHWREARGKLNHVSNRADFLMDRERTRKRAAYAAKRAAEGKPVRERTTKRQLDVDFKKWCKILHLPGTQDERATFVSACKLERRRAAYKAMRQGNDAAERE